MLLHCTTPGGPSPRAHMKKEVSLVAYPLPDSRSYKLYVFRYIGL